MMAEHRIYFLDVADHVKSPAVVLSCADDNMAIEEARQFLDGKPLEIWLNDRRVGRLAPE